MSSRGQFMDINERRLRPIYDCLDSGNNKKAIQEADKVLRKHKDLLCAKALKALALLRIGKNEESVQLLHEVHVNHPNDESTLQAMTICYKEIPKLDSICDLYEHADELKPDNEDILSALFMAYVRVNNYKKQQQIAMKLHRLKPSKNPYYFWAIMSIIMQAHNAESKLANSMYLPLAERMASKYYQENKYEAEAEVLLYLMVLDMVGHHENALQIIDGPLGSKIKSDQCLSRERKIDILHNLENWSKLNTIYQTQLLEDSDDWSSYVGYFSTLFKLKDANWVPLNDSENGIHHTTEQGFAFIQELKAKNSDNLSRGLMISHLYYLKQVKDNNCEIGVSSNLYFELLYEFFHKFGSKLCCYADLQGYINSYENVDLLPLFDFYNLLNKDGSLAKPVDLSNLQRMKCLVQMQFYKKSHEDLENDKKLGYISELLGLYIHSLSFGVDLLENDIQYGDEFLIIASLIKLDIYKTSNQKVHLIDAVYYLEYGLTKSRANFQIKVLLIQLYAHLGIFSSCSSIYSGLEVKHAQNDTLGYLVIYHAFQLGHFVTANSINATILKFFHNAHKEISECLVSCYRYGSFSQIYEFILFRDKLNNSLQFLMSRIEQLFYNTIVKVPRHEDMCIAIENSSWFDTLNDRFWDNLQDDRDFTIFKPWLSKDVSIDVIKKASYDDCLTWIFLRYLQLQIIFKYNSLCSLGQNHDGLSAVEIKDIVNLRTRLEEHLDKCGSIEFSNEDPVWCSYKTSLSIYMSNNVGNIFLEMIEITHNFSIASSDSVPSEVFLSSLSEFCSGFKTLFHSFLDFNTNGEQLQFKSNLLKNMVILTELCCQIVSLMGICYLSLKPLKNEQRKNKKKQSKLVQNEFISVYQRLLDDIIKILNDVLQSIPSLDDVNLLLKSMNELKLLPDDCDEQIFNNKDYSKLQEKIECSYYKALEEMKECLTMKLNFLSTLKH